MDNRQKELSEYRVQEADNSLKASMNCLNSGLYKDSINRSYYAAFYAIKQSWHLEKLISRDIRTLLHILIKSMLQRGFSRASWESG